MALKSKGGMTVGSLRRRHTSKEPGVSAATRWQA